jgi:hypothetical protein
MTHFNKMERKSPEASEKKGEVERLMGTGWSQALFEKNIMGNGNSSWEFALSMLLPG